MDGGCGGFAGTSQRSVPKRDKSHQAPIYGSAMEKPKSYTFYPPDAVYQQYATDIPDMGGLPFLLGKQISQTVLYTSMKNTASFQFSSVIFQDIL